MEISRNDLSIPLSDSLVKPVRKWTERFRKHEENWIAFPKIERNVLQISALSFPFFLAYADTRDSNDLDIHRLKVTGIRQIRRLLTESRTVRQERAYLQALENIESIAIGEFLQSGEV